MFLRGKSGRKISQEIWDFEISRFPGNLCRDPRESFLYFKGFNCTDFYHSEVKMRLCSVSIFFYSLKIIFQNFLNFLRPNAWEITKFFLNLLKKSNSVRQNNIKKCLKLN